MRPANCRSGLMLFSGAHRDDALLDAALQIEPLSRERDPMQVAVIGAGIVGVTTAWELVSDGHEVTVFERRGSVAAETSFANAGLVAPGYVTPWAAPDMSGKVLRHLFAATPRCDCIRRSPRRRCAGSGAGGALATRRPTPQPRRVCCAWHARAASGCPALRPPTAARLRARHGALVLLREARDAKLARPALKLLAELGVRFHLLDGAGCRASSRGWRGHAAARRHPSRR